MHHIRLVFNKERGYLSLDKRLDIINIIIIQHKICIHCVKLNSFLFKKLSWIRHKIQYFVFYSFTHMLKFMFPTNCKIF